jgi:hypothetical protein
MRTDDDIWISERDPWGADRLDWEDEEQSPAHEPDERAEELDDSRY